MEPQENSSVDVIVPCFNEAEVLPAFHARINAVIERLPMHRFRLIFVDDGSTDGTLEWLRMLSGRDARVSLVALARNFGHQAAITAGMNRSTGRFAVVIDADLQDPPELVPQMLAKLEAGFEIVHAVRSDRRVDSPAKRWSARVFYWFMRRFVVRELPRDAGDFKAFSREALAVMRQHRERVRFLRGLAATAGLRQCSVPYVRSPRHSGRSKYPLQRILLFSTDAVLSFSALPLRISFVAGTLAAVVAGAFFVALIAGADAQLALPPAILATFAALAFGAYGAAGEYLYRVLQECKQRPPYIVRGLCGDVPAIPDVSLQER